MNSTNDGVGDADVLAALRRTTASRHALLDAGLPLSGAAPSLADYVSHLTLLRDWLGPLQAWLDGFDDGPQVTAGLAASDRLGLIASDLAEPCLGAADPGRAGARARGQPCAGTVHRNWPAGASPAYRWGVCYVIEGAQLGGAVLFQRLSGRLAPHPLRYLRGQPEGPGPRWRAFMLALRANVKGNAEIADACAGACDAFDAILALAGPMVTHPRP